MEHPHIGITKANLIKTSKDSLKEELDLTIDSPKKMRSSILQHAQGLQAVPLPAQPPFSDIAAQPHAFIKPANGCRSPFHQPMSWLTRLI